MTDKQGKTTSPPDDTVENAGSLKALIVVPCYNEEKRLTPKTFSSYIEKHPTTGFVFVDDGSRDNTLQVLMQMRIQHHNNINVIRLEKNSGKAEAVRSGLTYAVAQDVQFVGYWDADLATPLEAIDDFLSVMDRYESVGLVYGARKRLLGRRIYRTLKRRIISRICALMARFAILMPVTDTQCGAKVLRNTPATRTAVSIPFKTDWLFDVELFARLAQLMPQPNASFYEYPLSEWEEIAGSKITGTTVVQAGFSILKLIARIHLFDKKMEVIDSIPPLPASAYVIPSMEIDPSKPEQPASSMAGTQHSRSVQDKSRIAG